MEREEVEIVEYKAVKPCSYYPKGDEGPVCDAGSEVVSKECTDEDEKECQWAKELKELQKKREEETSAEC